MNDYDPATYWSDVANRASQRPRGQEVAGNDAPYYRYKRQLFLERFLAQIPVEGQSLLEVGCGPGGNLRELAQRKPSRLVGCDVAPGMIELAQETVEDLGVEVKLIDGPALPFGDLEFAISITVTVLMHNPANRVASLAEEMVRVTRSSIYLIEDTVATQPSDEARLGEHGQIFPRTANSLAGFYQPHGFEVVELHRLRTRVSKRADSLFVKLFDRTHREEGEPYSRLHWIAGQITMPLTRVLDPLFESPDHELTLLHLRRIKPIKP